MNQSIFALEPNTIELSRTTISRELAETIMNPAYGQPYMNFLYEPTTGDLIISIRIEKISSERSSGTSKSTETTQPQRYDCQTGAPLPR